MSAPCEWQTDIRDAGIWLQIQPDRLQSFSFCSAGAKTGPGQGAKPGQTPSRNYSQQQEMCGQFWR